MFYQIFLSPQVEQIVIISNKHGIYKYMVYTDTTILLWLATLE